MNVKEYKETDLFGPIKSYFINDGFIGDGEVKGIDIYLTKDNLSVGIELKKIFDYKSIIQAALDQKTCDLVYIGIFRPNDLFSKVNKDKLYLLKRLGIGLIVVSPKTMNVEIVNDPIVSELSNFQKNHAKSKEKLKKELNRRRLKNNIGGVNKTKLMTAYKEDSLLILYYLNSLNKEATTRQLKELTNNSKVTSILYNNYYGWFENVSKGTYKITKEGKKALKEYKEIIKKMIGNKEAQNEKD